MHTTHEEHEVTRPYNQHKHNDTGRNQQQKSLRYMANYKIV